jgi:hypothetical protein
MYEVRWVDKGGCSHHQRFASWRFASDQARGLHAARNRKVSITSIRRDIFEVDLSTLQTWELARDKLLSHVAAEVHDLLTHNPDISLLIMPPRKRRKSG